MLRIGLRVLELLDRRERGLFALLLLAAILMAALELVAVAAVVPFLSLASDPSQLEANPLLAKAYELSGFAEPRGFLIMLGLAMFFAIVASNAWAALTLWAQLRFARGRAHALAVRLMQWYAAQPYVFFLRRNSAELSKNVLHEVDLGVERTLMGLLGILTRATVSLAIVGLLVAFDPLLAVSVALGLGLVYALAIRLMRMKMRRLGKGQVAANTRRYKAASELLGAIKEIKLLGKERELLRHFASASARFTRIRVSVQFLSEAPRYLLEATAFGGVVLIAVYYLSAGANTQQVIPVLGLYAFAGYRLLPSLQQIFRGAMQLYFGYEVLDGIYDELRADDARALPPAGSAGRLQLLKKLELEDVNFAYPDAKQQSLRQITFELRANSTLGIVGPTGAGKSTLVDLILGLLRPDSGGIRIDGVPLTESNLRAWQNNVGYVPQQIYLADDTVARNIAFGMPDSEISMAMVEKAARTAQIHDFILTELAAGYDTVVGERGVRLSGGQRQRIGIARALYQDPEILVFDEATSALDSKTETMLMDAIEPLAGSKTLILISHRRETLKWADAVIELQAGRIASRSRTPSDHTTAALGGH